VSGAPARPRSPAAVVVAHPDDEILWLSGVVASVDRIVFCFGDQFDRPKSSAARRRAVAALPLAGLVDLGFPESGAGVSVDWTRPQTTPTGIEITDAEARARYEANYPRLVDALRQELQGYGNVYTHNPWGEYGHAEHIQVYRAVATLQAELGCTIWFSTYVGAASRPLARRVGRLPVWTHRRTIPSDPVLAHRLKRLYQRHGAWTWTRFHRWPASETLYARLPEDSAQTRRPLAGEWLLDVSRLRWWLPWRAALWRLD
jgi:LmbE family N-acetylglucosaminyl deacetylase